MVMAGLEPATLVIRGLCQDISLHKHKALAIAPHDRQYYVGMQTCGRYYIPVWSGVPWLRLWRVERMVFTR